MALVLCTHGEGYMLTQSFADALTLRLYTNDYTPVKASVTASFTEMAAADGYSAIALTGGDANWVQSGSNPTQAAYAEQTFTFTNGPHAIYGYFVTIDGDGNTLFFGERFTGAPFNIVNNGDAIKVTLRFTQV